MAEFRINISNLSEGIHEYFLEAEPSKIGLDERFDGLLKVNAKIDKSQRQILLHAQLYVQGIFECDRCLDKFSRQIEVKYSMVYMQGDRSTIGTRKGEEIQVISSDTNYIDLDEDVRQYINLMVPLKLLCRENCLGLCPVCGINKNNDKCDCEGQTKDSRWDALRNYRINN